MWECWDGSTERYLLNCPPEPRWLAVSYTDAFGDPVAVAQLVSDDGDATLFLICAEDALGVFVFEGDDPSEVEGDSSYRPDGPGNLSGRFLGKGQGAASGVSWQALGGDSAETAAMGVYLPKSFRRSFIEALRSGNELIVDWFHHTDTFAWPAENTSYETPLEACDW